MEINASKSVSTGQDTGQITPQAIQTWLAQNSIPIPFLTSGSGFDDLQPLRQILRDVKVVGLGESTHGTREFFQFKHRLVEFLVMEMGFTCFTMESSMAAGEAINDYILSGRGDLRTALTNQGYLAWDTEEFMALLIWLRDYNTRAEKGKKVSFHGVDICKNDLNRAKVIDYLGRVAPDRLASVGVVLNDLANEEKKWPLQLDATHEIRRQLYTSLQDLADEFAASRERFIRRSSAVEFTQIQHAIEVMKQWLVANTPELQSSMSIKSDPRSRYMAENLIGLIDQGKPDAKYIYWAHNWHVGKGDLMRKDNQVGYCLRQKYGSQYYALGLLTNEGTFLTRANKPDGSSDYLKKATIPPAAERTFGWYLSHGDLIDYMINLREPAQKSLGNLWLRETQVVSQGSWFTKEGDELTAETNILDEFDGIAFFRQTNASHPTLNAIKNCENLTKGYF